MFSSRSHRSNLDPRLSPAIVFLPFSLFFPLFSLHLPWSRLIWPREIGSEWEQSTSRTKSMVRCASCLLVNLSSGFSTATFLHMGKLTWKMIVGWHELAKWLDRPRHFYEAPEAEHPSSSSIYIYRSSCLLYLFCESILEATVYVAWSRGGEHMSPRDLRTWSCRKPSVRMSSMFLSYICICRSGLALRGIRIRIFKF